MQLKYCGVFFPADPSGPWGQWESFCFLRLSCFPLPCVLQGDVWCNPAIRLKIANEVEVFTFPLLYILTVWFDDI